MRAMILVCVVPVLLWAQDYYEASGRTAVFTLQAGAKAPPASVKQGPAILKSNVPFRVVYAGNWLRVTGGAPGMLRIYRLNGREIGAWQVDNSGVVTLSRPLCNDVYLLRFEARGMAVKTARLAVLREGGSR